MESQSILTSSTQVWDLIAAQIRDQLSDASWNTWFAGCRVDSKSQIDDITILVPSSVAHEKITAAFSSIIEDAIENISETPIKINFIVETRTRDEDNTIDIRNDIQAQVAEKTFTTSQTTPPSTANTTYENNQPNVVFEHDETGLNPRYTFDHFVIGTSNRFAHAAALSVAESPARSYNPLFIYGSAGLGKTHLLHAIGHYVMKMFPNKKVRYVSTETFMNEFVESIRTNSTAAFKKRYREVDVLLVDDIQFLERSQQLQEEFFYTFNSLHQAASQIVLSSDRPPKSIQTLEDRLRSRFEWGLITDVQPPEFETRLAILRKKAYSEGLHNVPDEVMTFIASNIYDNVRELEGALIRVAAYSSLHRAVLTEDVAKQVLSDLLPDNKTRVITPQVILEETANMFSWSIEDLCGSSRRRPLVTARQIGMYVFRELTDYSFPRIAEVFGGRDHTTVMHAVEKVKQQMTEKPMVFEQVNELIGRIKMGPAQQNNSSYANPSGYPGGN
ncbi:MAG: chromosomal replication initiator protein DnaA [Acidimicrobiia bacterium]